MVDRSPVTRAARVRRDRPKNPPRPPFDPYLSRKNARPGYSQAEGDDIISRARLTSIFSTRSMDRVAAIGAGRYHR